MNTSTVGSRLLARNTFYNFLGQAAPIVVAIVAIPILIDQLGTDRFGVLTLAWMAIGYLSLFDLGLSRAVTKMVSERLGSDRHEEIPEYVWTGLLLMGVLGLVGTFIVIPITPWLIDSVLRIPPELRTESVHSFYLIGISLPIVVSTAGLRGILEAAQRFDLISIIRVPMGIFSFAGPLLVLPFSTSLTPIIAILTVARLIAWWAHLSFGLRALPQLRRRPGFAAHVVSPLMRFGGWLTVSNLVSPIMAGMDRFIIGGMISMAAVTYYVTPYEVVTKLWIFPTALLGVLFPAFAGSFSARPERTALLFDQALRVIFLAIFPIVLVLTALAAPGLDLWLGAEFVRNSTRVLQWLAIGIMINSVGQVGYTALQAIGRPDITGKLHLVELPIYLAGLFWLLDTHGVAGAALAWTLRVTLDTSILLWLAGASLPGGAEIVRNLCVRMVPALIILVGFMFLEPPVLKAVLLLLMLGAFALTGWRYILSREERNLLRRLLRVRIVAS